MARQVLIAPHGGLSWAWCATIVTSSTRSLSRLRCALGHHSLVSVLLPCRLPLPPSSLADAKPRPCLTDRVSLPTIVRGRFLWPLGDSDSTRAAAFTASYGRCQRAALAPEPSYRGQGVLIDGLDRTTQSLRTLWRGARLGTCLRQALNTLPAKLVALAAPVRQGWRVPFHALCPRCRQRTRVRVVSLGPRLRHVVNDLTVTEGEEPGERVRPWMADQPSGGEAVLEDPQMPEMRTRLDQAHHARDRKWFAMQGCHHPSGSQAAFRTGLAHRYHLIPYQRRAKNAGLSGVEVEGGRVPTSDGMLHLHILTSGGYRPAGMGATT